MKHVFVVLILFFAFASSSEDMQTALGSALAGEQSCFDGHANHSGASDFSLADAQQIDDAIPCAHLSTPPGADSLNDFTAGDAARHILYAELVRRQQMELNCKTSAMGSLAKVGTPGHDQLNLAAYNAFSRLRSEIKRLKDLAAHASGRSGTSATRILRELLSNIPFGNEPEVQAALTRLAVSLPPDLNSPQAVQTFDAAYSNAIVAASQKYANANAKLSKLYITDSRMHAGDIREDENLWRAFGASNSFEGFAANLNVHQDVRQEITCSLNARYRRGPQLVQDADYVVNGAGLAAAVTTAVFPPAAVVTAPVMTFATTYQAASAIHYTVAAVQECSNPSTRYSILMGNQCMSGNALAKSEIAESENSTCGGNIANAAMNAGGLGLEAYLAARGARAAVAAESAAGARATEPAAHDALATEAKEATSDSAGHWPLGSQNGAQAQVMDIKTAQGKIRSAWIRTRQQMRIRGIADTPENQKQIEEIFEKTLGTNGVTVVDAPHLIELRDAGVPEYIIRAHTVDHHTAAFFPGPNQNSTTQLLDRLDPENSKFVSPDQFNRNFRHFSSDNMGDGYGLARFVARNSDTIRANPELRERLRTLALQEDFGFFGNSVDLEKNDDLAALVRLNDSTHSSLPDQSFMDRVNRKLTPQSKTELDRMQSQLDQVLLGDRQLTHQLAQDFRNGVAAQIPKIERDRVPITGSDGHPSSVFMVDATKIDPTSRGPFETWRAIPEACIQMERAGGGGCTVTVKFKGSDSDAVREVVIGRYSGRGQSFTKAADGHPPVLDSFIKAEGDAVRRRLSEGHLSGDALKAAQDRLKLIESGKWQPGVGGDGLIFGPTYMTKREVQQFLERPDVLRYMEDPALAAPKAGAKAAPAGSATTKPASDAVAHQPQTPANRTTSAANPPPCDARARSPWDLVLPKAHAIPCLGKLIKARSSSTGSSASQATPATVRAHPENYVRLQPHMDQSIQQAVKSGRLKVVEVQRGSDNLTITGYRELPAEIVPGRYYAVVRMPDNSLAIGQFNYRNGVHTALAKSMGGQLRDYHNPKGLAGGGVIFYDDGAEVSGRILNYPSDENASDIAKSLRRMGIKVRSKSGERIVETNPMNRVKDADTP